MEESLGTSVTHDDILEAPLLVDGSAGRPRPHRFTFLEVLMLPAPTSIPMNARTCAGIVFLLSISYAIMLPPVIYAIVNQGMTVLFMGMPFAFLAAVICWMRRSFIHVGPVRFLQGQLRFISALYGTHSRFVAMTLYRLGYYHESQNELEQALECYQSITAFPICSCHPGAAPFYAKVGNILYMLGRYEEALEAFETCLTLQQKLEKKAFVLRLQSYLHRIGQTHERLGHWDKALQTYTEAHTALQERGQNQSVNNANSLIHIGNVFVATNKLKEGLENYQAALDIYVFNVGEFPCSKVVAELYTSMAQVHEKQGANVLAVEHYNLAIDVYKRGGRSEEDRNVQTLLRKIADLEGFADRA